MDPDLSRRAFLGGTALGALAATTGCIPQRGRSTGDYYDTEDIPYGTEPMQSGTLTIPNSPRARPVAILIHGGYWRTGFTREAMRDLAGDLARIGWAAWNIDYRRVGDPGGGVPGTLADVAAAIDKLPDLPKRPNLDLDRVVVLGHSAGAQLALWAAARGKLRDGQLGAAPRVRPKAAVSLSGVLDLAAAATAPSVPAPPGTTGPDRIAELRGATINFIGGAPDEVPDRYRELSPSALLPIGLPQLLMHGVTDEHVPFSQSADYAQAATRAGDAIKLVELPKLNHFEVVKSTKAAWDTVLAWLTEKVGDPLQ